jgi:hypothetical protein
MSISLAFEVKGNITGVFLSAAMYPVRDIGRDKSNAPDAVAPGEGIIAAANRTGLALGVSVFH